MLDIIRLAVRAGVITPPEARRLEQEERDPDFFSLLEQGRHYEFASTFLSPPVFCPGLQGNCAYLAGHDGPCSVDPSDGDYDEWLAERDSDRSEEVPEEVRQRLHDAQVLREVNESEGDLPL